MKGVLKKTGLFLLSAAGIMLILIGTYTIFSDDNTALPSPMGENMGMRMETPTDVPPSTMREDMIDDALRCVVGISSADESQGLNQKTQW